MCPIIINETLEEDIDKILNFFDGYISACVSVIYDIDLREDCKQELRLKIWDLFKKKDKEYNENYIRRRLRWDVINFLNRDRGYLFSSNNMFVDSMEDMSSESLVLYEDTLSNLEEDEKREKISVILEKAKKKMSEKEYESLMLFLSCEKNNLIKEFYGLGTKKLSRYYLNLSSALLTVRKFIEDEDYFSKRESTS